MEIDDLLVELEDITPDDDRDALTKLKEVVDKQKTESKRYRENFKKFTKLFAQFAESTNKRFDDQDDNFKDINIQLDILKNKGVNVHSHGGSAHSQHNTDNASGTQVGDNKGNIG